MIRLLQRHLLLSSLLLAAMANAHAQDVVIRNATVHTVSERGTLRDTDVLVRDGRIAAIGKGLDAPANIASVDAKGRPLTPALFAGITDIGVEEVSGEDATVDSALTLKDGQPVRPEFDVTLAFNPESILIPVARVEGLGFTVVAAGSGGAFVAGQGGVARLDGNPEAIGPRALFVKLGSAALSNSGQSRAAQWMLLNQLVGEARGKVAADSPHALLTPAGRATLKQYLDGQGRIVVEVQRAADIRQLLGWAAREKVSIAISGGAEAWKLAPELARARVPVFVDVLSNLPANFDSIGATLENAAHLQRAGVAVSFTQSGDASHNARKIRQLAGNAVANGLPWEAGLAGLTRVPAETFGVAGQIGSIEIGKRADLTLWDGDPLDVGHTADQLWLDGKAIPMRSRQTELRDRYLDTRGDLPHAYSR